MASSRRRESNMGEFLMMIDPNDSETSLSSPEPRFQLHEASIDSFLNEFSTDSTQQYSSLDSFNPPPETDGKRPESPEGKTRSRPLTPSLDDGFDFRSLNITPEPRLGQPSGGFDSPPAYNSWSTDADKKKAINEEEEKPALPEAAEGSSTTQRGLLPWYNDVSGNRASFHSLDELQPPSYPSLAVGAPERHTWSGDGKGADIWERYMGNATDEEAAEILRKAEIENSPGSNSRLSRFLGLKPKVPERPERQRSKSPPFLGRRSVDDELLPPSPTFGRPRRDTGAWWLFGKDRGDEGNASQTIYEEGPSTCSSPSPTQVVYMGTPEAVQQVGELPQPSTSATEQPIEDVEASIEQTIAIQAVDEKSLSAPLFSETELTEAQAMPELSEIYQNIDVPPIQFENQPAVGVCGICGTDLHYHQGEASENWYMTLKNHFEVAHGNWAARMPDWFSSPTPSPDKPEDGETLAGPDEMDLDNQEPETHLPQKESSDNIRPKFPEASKEPKEEEPAKHECPVPNCTESFAIFQELNIHIFDRHGLRGTPLGLTKPKAGKHWSRGRSTGHECPSFSCNTFFDTYEDRDRHMEEAHGIKPQLSQLEAGYSDKMLVDDLWTDEPLQNNENEVAEFFPLFKKPVDSIKPIVDSATIEEIKSPEFRQLWRGFATSIKMNDDVQPESSNHHSLGVYSASEVTDLKPQLKPIDALGEDDKMFNRTMSELLKVVRQTYDSGPTIAKDSFDMHGWLQGHLSLIGSEAAELLITSSPTYYENIDAEPDAAEWAQKVRSELSRLRPKKSNKGKERSTEYLPMNDTTELSPAKVDLTYLELQNVRDPGAEETSRIKLAAMNTRFLTAADSAYHKLIAGTKRSSASNEFKNFVASLGGVEDIVDVGMTVVDQILNEEVPTSLREVYCFLHVAYAISQSESLSPEKVNDFQAGLSVFRYCLPDIADIPGTASERDIFDEIASVMSEELEYALKWIKTWDGNEVLNKVGYSANEVEGLKDFMRNHCEKEQDGMAVDMTIDPKLLSLGSGVEPQPPAVVERSPKVLTTWEDIVDCGILAIIVRWLRELKGTGVIFAYLCGGLCTSLASSFKKRVKFKDRITDVSSSQLESHLQQDVVTHLNSYKYAGVENVTDTAISLLKQGYISTIREFENHMVSLARVRRRKQEEFCAFVYAIVWHCNSCATFVPDNLWRRCKRIEDVDYSLQYVDERVNRELCWFSGKPVEEDPVTVNQVAVQENTDVSIEQLRDFAMGEDIARPLNVGMCAIDTILLPPTPTKVVIQENSPYSTASSSSPNNYDSLWDNSPRGHQGSETSCSNPNSNNVTPDEIYVNPNMPNSNNFATDYFSYSRPQVPVAGTMIVEQQASSSSREPKPKASRKRKYLEGDGASAFPARRRKMIATTGKRLYCDVPGCEEFASTSSNLSRHKRTKHGNKAVREASYHCECAGCDRVFYGTRGKGNLRTHLRKDHGM
ncbi:hypothetical protein ABW20_dc0105661 [Dactylellina cionopaga]|nr:hypothetical protein ABW20_dc0105661 [Dactylellina cionopaga]